MGEMMPLPSPAKVPKRDSRDQGDRSHTPRPQPNTKEEQSQGRGESEERDQRIRTPRPLLVKTESEGNSVSQGKNSLTAQLGTK